MKPKDLAGVKFTKLTPIKIAEEKYRGNRTVWECLCDCGGTKKVAATHLIQGLVKSCGCMRYQMGKAMRIYENYLEKQDELHDEQPKGIFL